MRGVKSGVDVERPDPNLLTPVHEAQAVWSMKGGGRNSRVIVIEYCYICALAVWTIYKE